MPTSWRRRFHDSARYIVVDTENVVDSVARDNEGPTATVHRSRRRPYTKRQAPEPTNADDSDDEESSTLATIPTTAMATATSAPPAVRTLDQRAMHD